MTDEKKDEVKKADTLEDLLKEYDPTEKERVYEVKHGDVVQYVMSNSQANAAFALCEVTTISKTKIQDAKIKALQKKLSELEGD